MPFCPKCGKEVSEGVKFCPGCGQRLKKGFTSDKRRDKGGIIPGGYRYPYGVKPPWMKGAGGGSYGMSDYEEELERFMRRKEPWEEEDWHDPFHVPFLEEPKVVSTKTIVCRRRRGETHTALLLVHEDETIKVKCRGDCSDCVYGDVE